MSTLRCSRTVRSETDESRGLSICLKLEESEEKKREWERGCGAL